MRKETSEAHSENGQKNGRTASVHFAKEKPIEGKTQKAII